MKFPDFHLILHCHCQKATELTSDSLERPLTWSERWALRFHLAVCKGCRLAARQIRALHRLAADMPDHLKDSLNESSGQLSPAARKRISSAMRQQDS